MNEKLSTAEFAAGLFVKPETVRRAVCTKGHYFGVKPSHLPNGYLSWERADLEKLLSGEIKPRVRNRYVPPKKGEAHAG